MISEANNWEIAHRFFLFLGCLFSFGDNFCDYPDDDADDDDNEDEGTENMLIWMFCFGK